MPVMGMLMWPRSTMSLGVAPMTWEFNVVLSLIARATPRLRCGWIPQSVLVTHVAVTCMKGEDPIPLVPLPSSVFALPRLPIRSRRHRRVPRAPPSDDHFCTSYAAHK